jgi:hypothetical protein
MNRLEIYEKVFGIEQYKYKPFFLPEGGSLWPDTKSGFELEFETRITILVTILAKET